MVDEVGSCHGVLQEVQMRRREASYQNNPIAMTLAPISELGLIQI